MGGTLFWCLSGKPPFPPGETFTQELFARLTQAAPSVRAYQPRVPAALDAIVARMKACSPEDRYPTAQAVMTALLRFLEPSSHDRILPCFTDGSNHKPAPPSDGAARVHRVLVVDDSPTSRKACVFALADEGFLCDEAADGLQALAAAGAKPYDLVVTDWNMPTMNGLELCRRLRQSAPSSHLKIILFSAEVTDDTVAEALAAGADDYLTKAFSPVQLMARIKAALRLKDAQDRGVLLNHHLLEANQKLEENLKLRDGDLIDIRSALVLGMADLVSCRDNSSVSRCMRVQSYCRCLAEEAARLPALTGQIDEFFIQMLECCAPLHDIGNVGLPDHLLTKAGNLDAEERLMMQTHTIIGAETLQRVAQRHGSAVAFLQMAIDVARHHHERYDGTGYPDRLAGGDIPLAARLVAIGDIPLAARLVAIGDVYDGLRTRRAYKPALSHAAALQVILESSAGHFDPLLLHALRVCSPQFDRIFQESQDSR